ncbi:DUF6159 family protein [Kitasatospora cheerisanensis]|uniref:Uncharacterized protein n=1 Tax=Kitasatospora cheerisanensis KCTC 2395 TaxID=1348663 RepID=A0A066Z0C7_9ACTN|nr:DUF6159 family protein [Kitasatospora cheerisanensis]KDN87223.1 hypothetical protein KCH_09940 [Kitasatospora cheerisanensis KCTC 2395]
MATAHPVRASWGILRRRGGLVVFPLLGAAQVLVIGSAAVAPAVLNGTGGAGPGTVAALVAGYLALGFGLTVSTAALIRAVADALDGTPARYGANLRAALAGWRRLLGWSLLGSTVLLAARQLDRIPVVGELLDQLVDVAWSLATYLVLPGIALDDLPIREATRRSGRLLRATFTRQIFGSLWIGLPLLLAGLGGLVAVMLAIESDRPGPAVAAAVLAGLVLAAALLVGATVSGIFRTVLYREAVAERA